MIDKDKARGVLQVLSNRVRSIIEKNVIHVNPGPTVLMAEVVIIWRSGSGRGRWRHSYVVIFE